MPLTNTPTSYGTVTKLFHWLIALFILGVLVTGTLAHNLGTTSAQSLDWKIRLYSMHKTMGLAIFFTALARIAWALSQPKPGMIGQETGLLAFLAELVHWVLYVALVLVPLTGWMTHAATEGFAPIKWPFGQELPFVPNDPELAERFATLHHFFKLVMVGAVLLHIAGALKHHIIDRDATLRRMWFGRPALPQVPRHTAGVLAPAVAASVFALVGIGAGLQPVGTTQTGAALEQVTSQWQVQEGTVEITVEQMGTQITGAFADWTAAITFDDNTPETTKGSADVTISVGSLSLGSVTAEALAADFLSAEAFPTAHVTGDLVATEAAYELRGTITIKGTEMPLSLPFTLEIDGDTATAQGSTTLLRRDFNVGESMPDGGTVGLEVLVSLSLTATRAATDDAS